MIPGTRPIRRVARAAPFPVSVRRSALRLEISGMDGYSLQASSLASSAASGLVQVGQVRPDGDRNFLTPMTTISIEQAGDRALLADPADRLTHKRRDC